VAGAEEAAVERKDARRVRALLSELQVLEWQELVDDRPKWRKVLESTDIRREFGTAGTAQSHLVDQPRALT
jgi:hypothetical protein